MSALCKLVFLVTGIGLALSWSGIVGEGVLPGFVMESADLASSYSSTVVIYIQGRDPKSSDVLELLYSTVFCKLVVHMNGDW